MKISLTLSLLIYLVISLFSSLAYADNRLEYTDNQRHHRGPIFLCKKSDYSMFARVRPHAGEAGEALAYKSNPKRPSYFFTDCEQTPSRGIVMGCTGEGGRAFIFRKDLTALYIGSHRQHELTCTFAK